MALWYQFHDESVSDGSRNLSFGLLVCVTEEPALFYSSGLSLFYIIALMLDYLFVYNKMIFYFILSSKRWL